MLASATYLSLAGSAIRDSEFANIAAVAEAKSDEPLQSDASTMSKETRRTAIAAIMALAGFALVGVGMWR